MKTREKVTWRGPIDGPWPMVHVGGDLELAERLSAELERFKQRFNVQEETGLVGASN